MTNKHNGIQNDPQNVQIILLSQQKPFPLQKAP